MKLTNTQKIELILKDLECWIQNGDSDCSLQFAYRHGYYLHAASMWIGSGAMSEGIEQQVRGVRISRKAEMKEIHDLCKQAHIYICPDCNHHAFMDDDEGEEIQCSSCLKTAKREVRK
jgi:hypothetical protein